MEAATTSPVDGWKMSEVRPPVRTLDQRMEALMKGNRIRTRRAKEKVAVKECRIRVEELIMEQEDWIETAKLSEFVIQTPGIGRVKCNRLLNLCRISPTKTFGGATYRQRRELVMNLKRWREGTLGLG